MSLSEAGYSVVSFSGDLDLNDRESILNALHPLADADAPLIDLSKVSYLDSTFLGAVLGLNKAVNKRGKRLSLIVTDPRVMKIFEMTKLNQLFDIFVSEEAALRRNIVGLNPHTDQAS